MGFGCERFCTFRVFLEFIENLEFIANDEFHDYQWLQSLRVFYDFTGKFFVKQKSSGKIINTGHIMMDKTLKYL